MKKVAIILVLSIGFLTSAFGQEKTSEKMTAEQKTELHLKKMTLKLDLSSEQAKQIKPLLLEQVRERKAMKEKRKSLKNSNKKLTADERFAIKSALLDKKIAFKKEMKRILNEKQYEKFERKANQKVKKMKKRKGKKGKKNKN